MSVPEKDRRKAIIYRLNHKTTVVQASAIQSVDELAYAMNFLAHHRLYKMSRGACVSAENARDVADAFEMAAEEFQAAVIDELEGVDETKVISELGAGEVKNPFEFV